MGKSVSNQVSFVVQNVLDPVKGINLAMREVDARLQVAVIAMDLTTPPASPDDGDEYIIPAAATGAWTGRTNQLAYFDSDYGHWRFANPPYIVFNVADKALYCWNGSNYVQVAVGTIVT